MVTLIPDATIKGAAGGLVRGTVTSESPTEVEVKLGNTVTTIPTNEIASISYDGHPASLEQAQAKESANALAEAADLYKKAATEAAGKPFIAEDAIFGQARALAELGPDRPGRSRRGHRGLLEGFLRTYTTGRHIVPALESLAKLQIARENYAGVEQTLAQLAKLPQGDDRAGVLRIKVLTRKGQPTRPLAELDKLIAVGPRRLDQEAATPSSPRPRAWSPRRSSPRPRPSSGP